MLGRMMNAPLQISNLIEYAAEVFPHRGIVSARVEGDIHRYSYRQARDRIAQLAHGLRSLGIDQGDRVATIAWNGYRHFEIYYAVSGIGAVCHTINPRLAADQLIYIINHAGDRVLFVDQTFVPLIERLIVHLPSIEHVVVMIDGERMTETALPRALGFEDLIATQPTEIAWPSFDENSAAGLCYSSGTTGNPKGVLYSHRSNVLHALDVALAAGGLSLSDRDVVLPVVPLFHVNAWGLPYVAPITGAGVVFPGPALDGESLFKLMDDEGVTGAWGVPTVWHGLLEAMAAHGAKPRALKLVVIGGSAPPRSMIEAFMAGWGIRVVHGWGMTELSPVGALGLMRSDEDGAASEEQIDRAMRQGRRMCLMARRIVDENDADLPHDGVARGELTVRGPYVAAGYFGEDEAGTAHRDWFATGDIATIDERGRLMIVDRAKDIIKSGGEWISSIDLENVAMAHPGVAEAAVIGLPHPKWGERPLLILVARAGADLEPADVRGFLAGRVAKLWLPDDIVVVDELPHSATGKLQKAKLRERFADHQWPSAAP